MKEPTSAVLDSIQLLTVNEVMKLLKVSRSKLYGLMDRKQNPLPTVTIGSSRRFPLDKVRWWMENLGK